MRQLLLLLVSLGLAPSVIAQVSYIDATQQKFIHHLDPTGFILIESLQPGMTLYGLSKMYNVSIDSIFTANPDLNPQAIPLGYPVNIPIYPQAITYSPPQGTGESIPIYYRVQPKETLYRISKVYLDITPETIVNLNPRADQGLAIGQVLHLGWYTPEKNTVSPAGASVEAQEGMYVVKDFNGEYKSEGLTIREQKGLAVWKPGNIQSHYYVLHPTAKVGSYMEITNPMLRRTLTAKVAGNIPPGLYQSHVGLVVSPSVARALGVLDQQFFAQWRFVE